VGIDFSHGITALWHLPDLAASHLRYHLSERTILRGKRDIPLGLYFEEGIAG
jgi:hypothetical protein